MFECGGILSGRLVEGNKKVLEMGKELQASLLQLKSASGTGAGKSNQLCSKCRARLPICKMPLTRCGQKIQ